MTARYGGFLPALMLEFMEKRRFWKDEKPDFAALQSAYIIANESERVDVRTLKNWATGATDLDKSSYLGFLAVALKCSPLELLERLD